MLKIGDRVLFGKWSGTEVKIDGKEYSIMKEADIMGIQKENKLFKGDLNAKNYKI